MCEVSATSGRSTRPGAGRSKRKNSARGVRPGAEDSFFRIAALAHAPDAPHPSLNPITPGRRPRGASARLLAFAQIGRQLSVTSSGLSFVKLLRVEQRSKPSGGSHGEQPGRDRVQGKIEDYALIGDCETAALV